MGCPYPVYKGVEEGEGRPSTMARPGSPILPPGVGFLPFHVVGVGDKEGEEGREGRRGAAPPPSPTRTIHWGGARPASLSPLKPNKAHILPGEFPYLRYSDKYPNHSEPFRCPNIVVQYIDLYVLTISRLLVMSPISSGTPNYLRYIKTHKLIIPIVTER